MPALTDTGILEMPSMQGQDFRDTITYIFRAGRCSAASYAIVPYDEAFTSCCIPVSNLHCTHLLEPALGLQLLLTH